jgi:hypothetical protein
MEMLGTIKPLTGELREMPLSKGAGPSDPRAGIPYELPNQNLPSETAAQLQYLRDRIAESNQIRTQIQNTFNPTPKQQSLLTLIGNIDKAMTTKLA